ncbi:MAG TPA: hypothetical protein VF655_04700 [Allosphingosinicella sp.]|jgi:multisubunit Na+/H+ antiporter MnhE subunit
MAVGRSEIPGIAGVMAGLATFLTLAYGKSDVGDEFIYGLIVGALVWWLLRKILPTNGLGDNG